MTKNKCKLSVMMRVFPAVVVLVALGTGAMAADESAVRVELNGLQLQIDPRTGGIVGLHYGGTTMLEASSSKAGLVDLAVPVESFHALRLATRFSRDVQIQQADHTVTLEWQHLGASRDLPRGGEVKVTITLSAALDGRSVAMKCRIENQSAQPIKQVLFPDLSGLLPFAGDKQTYLRMAGDVMNPFTDLVRNPAQAPFYAIDEALAGRIYKAHDVYLPHCMRWLDFGGLKQGFSLWEKAWGYDPLWDIWVRRDETDGKVRLAGVHNVTIEPKTSWESGEFRLTPHNHGWGEGIQPFRAWVLQNIKRPFALPKHVREGLGYRSIFMMRGVPPNTKEDIACGIDDLVKMAADAKAHGVDEIVPWFWCPPFQIPFHTLPVLGTDETFAVAVGRCRELGVNISPFISCYVLANPTAERYGLKIEKTAGSGWTYHLELVPMFNPPYADAQTVVEADQTDQRWHDDVFDTWSKMIDRGVPSLVWDVYGWKKKKLTPNINDLTVRIREAARRKDPQSVFAAESCSYVDIEADYLDYTWNWITWADRRPFVSAFPTPRLNVNISECPTTVRLSFMDNQYLNLMPSRPNDVNGTAMLAEYPELSTAVKQCAQLRKQFLPYFVEGEMIGECVLAEECPGMHVTAYVLPKSLLMIALKREEKGEATTLKAGLKPWLTSASGKYQVKTYAMDGRETATRMTVADWQENLKSLKHGDMVLYEFEPAKP